MNIYHAFYKVQSLDSASGCWFDERYYKQKSVVVLAGNSDEAKAKVNQCIAKMKRWNQRAVLTSEVVECVGLDTGIGFDNSTQMRPIV